jgi:hypothetical protein
MFDSARSGLVLALGGGGDTTGLGGSREIRLGCRPFVLEILTGRGGIE